MVRGTRSWEGMGGNRRWDIEQCYPDGNAAGKYREFWLTEGQYHFSTNEGFEAGLPTATNSILRFGDGLTGELRAGALRN